MVCGAAAACEQRPPSFLSGKEIRKYHLLTFSKATVRASDGQEEGERVSRRGNCLAKLTERNRLEAERREETNRRKRSRERREKRGDDCQWFAAVRITCLSRVRRTDAKDVTA